MDMVLGVEWLIQLGSYATKLEEKFMELNWQGNRYKPYSIEGSTLKNNQLPPT
jgi:phage-related protein